MSSKNITELIEQIDVIEKELHDMVKMVPKKKSDYLLSQFHESYREEVLPWIDSLKRRLAECQK